ncbi:MAG TPA: MFS transporter, partial [Acidimicrobiales bacterium]|nr:MFS transporter [Acidimicrobiales bacterium]
MVTRFAMTRGAAGARPAQGDGAGPQAAITDGAGSGSLGRRLVLVMAVSTGLTIANNYYAQPLLPAIGHALHTSASLTGLVVTAAQVGYALGLVFLLPLGDLLERRRLIAILSLATAGLLVWVGASPTMAWLLPAVFAVGTVSVLAQIIVPFAAGLAGDQERGQIVGKVMSGLLLGILLARTIAGWLAETGTWRAVYFVAAGAMVVQSGVLAVELPTWKRPAALSYPRLVASTAALLRDEPVLRLRACFGLFSF